jgi:hypothetical protein
MAVKVVLSPYIEAGRDGRVAAEWDLERKDRGHNVIEIPDGFGHSNHTLLSPRVKFGPQ